MCMTTIHRRFKGIVIIRWFNWCSHSSSQDVLTEDNCKLWSLWWGSMTFKPYSSTTPSWETGMKKVITADILLSSTSRTINNSNVNLCMMDFHILTAGWRWIKLITGWVSLFLFKMVLAQQPMKLCLCVLMNLHLQPRQHSHTHIHTHTNTHTHRHRCTHTHTLGRTHLLLKRSCGFR